MNQLVCFCPQITSINKISRPTSHLHKTTPLVLFSIRNFSVLPFFLFTLLFKNKQLSGRDIICVPNALFISDRDFVQSFESRHGRHGNSNLVILFVSERNLTIVRELYKIYKRNKQTNKYENISKRKIIYRSF